MHESSLATSVLTVLRQHPGPYGHVRVHVADLSSSTEELTERLRAYLAAAQPAIAVTSVEVVLRARQRLCANCATAWTTPDPAPACPACDGPALPLPHDHGVEVELSDE